MALQDCIRKMSKIISKRDRELLEQYIAEGLSDQMAIDKLLVVADKKVVDIASRARDQGATVVKRPDVLGEIRSIGTKQLEAAQKNLKAVQDEAAEIELEQEDIQFVEDTVRTWSAGDVPIDLKDDTQLMARIEGMFFRNQEAFVAGTLGGGQIQGASPLAVFDSFKEMQGRKAENKDKLQDLIKDEVKLLAAREQITGQAQTLYQKTRGSISFNAARQATIRLYESANLSTFIHEAGHLYLEIMRGLAERDDAPQQIKDDWQKILDFLEVESGSEITTEHHEKWAESFEKYTEEGKAPSIELQDAFSSFRQWMLNVYRRIKNERVLTDDIRQVMDRMLASDDEIALAEASQGYTALFINPEQAGITPEAFEVYRTMVARAHSDGVEHETKKMLAAMNRASKQWWRDEKKKVRAEVEAEAHAMPIFQALAILQRGTNADGSTPLQVAFKLDKQSILDLVEGSQPFLKSLPGGVYRIKGGVSVDIAAEIFGFKDGLAFIDALVKAPKMKDWIAAETEVRMQQIYPDPLVDGTLAEGAIRSVHNEKRLQVLGYEMRELRRLMREDRDIVSATKKASARETRQAREANKASLPKRAELALLKAAAKETIQKMKIRDVRPHIYLNAERKTGRRAFDAAARGDFQTAYVEKRKQIVNHEMYRAAMRAVDASTSNQKYLAKFQSPRIQMKYGKLRVLDSILSVIESIDLAKVTVKELDRRAALQKLAEDIHAGVVVVNAEVANQLYTVTTNADGSETVTLNEDFGTNWQELTVEQFKSITDIVRQIVKQADRTLKMKVNGVDTVIDDVVTELAMSIEDKHKQVPAAVGTKTRSERAKESLNALGASMANPGHVAKLLDQDDFGAVNRLIVAPIRRAVSERLMPMQDKAGVDMTELYLKHYTRTELQTFGFKTFATIGGRRISKDEAMSVLMNMGSESNKAALLGGRFLNGKVAYPPGQVEAILSLLDERDLAFAQDLWDYLDTYWSQLAASEKERRGIAPEKVEAVPFIVTLKNGQQIKMRGGYYPLRYDRSQSDRLKAEDFEDYYKKMGNGVYVSSNTRAGATYNRVKNHGEVVQLGLYVAHNHLREITRDIAIGNEINYVKTILNNKAVRDAFRTTGNGHHLDAMVLWIADTAVGELPANTGWESIAAKLRTNFTMSRLILNFRVGLLQLAGLTQTAAIVGKRDTLKAVVKFATNPVAAKRLAFGKSAFLASRYQASSMAFDRDIADAVGRMQGASRGTPTHTKRIGELAQKLGFAPIFVMQGVVDITSWIAAYDKGLNRKGMTDAEAVIYADSQVQIAQTSGLWSDRSGFERGSLSASSRQSPAIRLWASLLSFMMSRTVNVYIETKTLGRDINIGSIVRYASQLTMLLVVDAYLVSLLYGRFDEDDEPEEKAVKVALEAGLGLVGGIPFIREAPAAMYGSGNTAIGTAATDVYHIINRGSEGDFDRKFWRHTIDLAGIVTGIPSSFINKEIDVLLSDDPEAIEYILGKKR